MAAVKAVFRDLGIGARLKWAQREEAMRRGVRYIKWTFQPVQARNAFLNLEKLGAVVRHYEPNFYGTDYSTAPDQQDEKLGLDSDRVFAEWHLESEKVAALVRGEKYTEKSEVARTIEIPNDWNALVKSNPREAIATQTRIKNEFQAALAEGLIAKGFERSETNPRFLLYKE